MKKLRSFINSMNILPGFVFPVFVADDGMWHVQKIGADGLVEGFIELPAIRAREEILRHDAGEIAIDRGGKALYAYAVSRKKVIVGDREGLTTQLNNWLAENPAHLGCFGRLEVLQFIGADKDRLLATIEECRKKMSFYNVASADEWAADEKKKLDAQ